MAVRVEKEKFTIGRDGRMRLQVRWLAQTRSEAMTGIPPTYDGLFRTDYQGQPWIAESGPYLVDAVYEGYNGGGEGPARQFDQAEITSEMREVKIEDFPDRDLLRELYGAYEEEGRLKFPPKIPAPARGGNGLNASDEEDNPFFNATTYLVEYELAVHQFVRSTVPAALLKAQLTIVNRLPEVFEYRGETKNWFIRPIRRRKIGNLWEITVEYQQVDELAAMKATSALRQQAKRSALDTFFG